MVKDKVRERGSIFIIITDTLVTKMVNRNEKYGNGRDLKGCFSSAQENTEECKKDHIAV